MKIASIHRAIDVATDRYRAPTIDQIIDVARELFPEEMAEAEASDARRGTRSRFRDAARQVGNVTEESDDAPTVTLDLFPGLPAPAYLNIAIHGGTSLLKTVNANDYDMEAAVIQRENKAAQIVRRAEDLARKRGFRQVHQASREETNAQIIERLRAQLKKQSDLDDSEAVQPAC